MRNEEFNQLYSEEEVDFNISSGKLIKKNPLQKIIKEGTKLSTIAKAYLQDTKKEPIRKRMTQMEPPPSIDTKRQSHREKAQQRFAGNNSETNRKVLDEGRELSEDKFDMNTPTLARFKQMESPVRLSTSKANSSTIINVKPSLPIETIKQQNNIIKEQKLSFEIGKTNELPSLPIETIKKQDNIINEQKLSFKIEKTKELPSLPIETIKKQDNIINEQKLPSIIGKTDGLTNFMGASKIMPNTAIIFQPEPERKQPVRKQGKERAARLQKMERAKQILSGKISIVWIYVLSCDIDEDLKERIYDVYKGLIDDSTIVPYCKNAWEIEPFLNLPDTYFKIVANLANIEDALRYKIHIKVVQFHIYNDEGQAGMSKALQFKSWTKKVKGIFTNLSHIIDRTQDQIQDTIQIYKYNSGLQVSVKQAKFPSFLKLSGKDKSEATLYRSNLYGSIKIDKEDKKANYQYFLMLVREKYGNVAKEQANIIDYTKIKHLSLITSIEQANQIIQFYVRQSFYYQVLNSMLRTLKTTQEFKPCILPFNQTYHSIKIYYELYLKQNKGKIPEMTLYRGAKLKKRDFKSLNAGDFIQMYGFMSTSKSFKSAAKFTDRDGYIFVIHIKAREISEKYRKYDHGFVDINRYHLATKQFQAEEEVLFNALNIYKITNIEDSGKNVMIYLQYGAIFDLLDKPKDTLTRDEKDTLINYQYCTKMMGDIEDQGDVHLIANEYEDAKDYYIQKINKNEQDAKSYFKLANVQKECGQIDEAEKNGQKSLKIYTEKMDLNDKETCLKIFSIHSKNAEINIEKEDYLNADDQITKSIELLDDSDIFTKAKKIRERGEIKFKKGEVKDAEKDFQLSQKLFQKVEKQGEQKRWDVKKKYMFSLMTVWCSSMTVEELEANKQQELTGIDELERQIASMKDQIEDQQIKVNKSLKDVAIYVEDKDKYQYFVKKGRAYLLNIQQRQTNDPVLKARLKVAEATIQDYLELAQSQKLLAEAIALIESGTPFDPSVGEYSTILAKLQKKQLQKFTNPQAHHKLSPDHILQYDQSGQKAIYNRCKSNFVKAINVLLYNSKQKDSPQVVSLKNQLGSLEFGQNQFVNCEEILNDIKNTASKLQHTQIAKTSLLLGKIAFCRGQLKNSFKILQQTDGLLQKTLIKSRQNPKYIAIYQKSDIYLQVLLIKSKVYHKQMHHDLSLKQLKFLQTKLNNKMDGYESHSLLASTYEQFGQVYANKGQRQFLDYFQKAIELRKSQMGQYNIFNAVSYCNYSKYLMMVDQIKSAEDQLSHAVQIFACMSNDHPINWVIYFSNGVYSQLKEQYSEADKLFKSSLKMAQKKFDSSHITIKKVRLKVAKVLLKMGDIDQSLKQLEQLQEEVDEDLKQSQTKVEVNDEKDDEKVTLQKIILNELKSVIDKEENNVRFTQIEIEKYKKKYDDLRRSFRLEGEGN